MSPAPDVLIITQAYDPTADFLIPHLDRAGLSWARWDPGDLPDRARAAARLDPAGLPSARVQTADGWLDLAACGVLWYRRPSARYAPAAVPTTAVGAFIDEECAHFVANLWRATDRPMIDDPVRGRAASEKLGQLRAADGLGLRIPRTLIGNEPSAIRELWHTTGGRMVVKAFRAACVDSGEAGDKMLYTAPVEDGDLADDAPLLACPSIWQELIPKQVDIRVVVVGDRVLAAQLDAQAGGEPNFDWRSRPLGTIPHAVHELPRDVADKCRAFVRSFGLHFSALDFILTPDGEYVFLENNPFGQWAWLENLCGLPLGDAFCALMTRLAGRSRARCA